MHSSPFNVTPEDRAGLDGNPWADSSMGDVDKTISEVQPKSPEVGHRSRDSNDRTTQHMRSYTTTGHPLCPPSPASPDDFQDVFGRPSSLDWHETRPTLKRIVNASKAGSDSTSSEDINGGSSADGEELQTEGETVAEVIVHQIKSTDSLPGVALKYNISLAALRSANKLWSSDSIHLRQVLYIPVQAMASTAKSMPTEPHPRLPSESRHSSYEVPTQSSLRLRRSASEWSKSVDSETTITHASAAHTISAGTNSTIKRVPLSELAFFPPSSATSALPSSRNRSRPASTSPSPSSPTASKYNTISAPARVSSTSSIPFFSGISGNSTPRLTSFLNGARDEIISRLSFDSARGSSDAGEEPEVEMHAVRPRDWRSSNKDGQADVISPINPKQNRAVLEVEPGLEQDCLVLNTPHKPKPKIVRTVQLQPSPRMEIPTTTSADKARSAVNSYRSQLG